MRGWIAAGVLAVAWAITAREAHRRYVQDGKALRHAYRALSGAWEMSKDMPREAKAYWLAERTDLTWSVAVLGAAFEARGEVPDA